MLLYYQSKICKYINCICVLYRNIKELERFWGCIISDFVHYSLIYISCLKYHMCNNQMTIWGEGHRGRDCMVVGFRTTCVISAYHHYSCEFELR